MTNSLISQRFRGFLPVVVDVETGGFDAKKMRCSKWPPCW